MSSYGQQKVGFYSLSKTARALCRFIAVFTPVIRKKFPDATDLHEALEVANAACEALALVIADYAEPGV